MKSAILCAVLLISCVQANIFTSTRVVLPPKANKNGTNTVFLLVQGAQIPSEQYLTLLEHIQDASKASIWACATNFIGNTPNPGFIDYELEQCLQSLHKIGLYKSAKIFVAGHSLGGIMIQDYLKTSNGTITVNGITYQVSGQLLFGSYVQRKYLPIETYPVPTMTVSGTLDGLCRITRNMEAFYHQNYNLTSKTILNNYMTDHFPVVAVKGLTHAQFFNGTPAGLVKARDLRPEITLEVAQETIANIVSDYVEFLLGGPSGPVRQRVQDTLPILRPLIEAFELEGYYRFRMPCYLNNVTGCAVGNPWIENVQSQMAGEPGQNFDIENTDVFHDVWQVYPTVHLPYVENRCASPANCTLRTHTVSQNAYSVKNWKLDTAFFPLSADEIRVKLSSRQRMYTDAGVSDPSFDTLDGPSICSQINNNTYSQIFHSLDGNAQKRFNNVGQPMVQLDDKVVTGGPLWIWGGLDFQNATVDGQLSLTVQSVTMKTPTNYFIKASAGFHYCKALSPARVAEWIMVDGLRAKYGINN